MTTLTLNPEFIKNIHDVYGANGATWLRELPQQIAQLAADWDFELINPLPHLSFSFVGTVRRRSDNSIAILKMTPSGSNINAEIKWLQSIDDAVPRIFIADEKQHAFLMENLTPGHSLKTLVKNGEDDKATKIICDTIRHLQSHQRKEFNFPHLGDLAAALPILHGHYDAGLLDEAQALFRELTQDRSEDIILHGDLHHDNILSCGSGWKAIDPHGYIGDPAAEAGVMIRNPFDCFPGDVAKVVKRRLRILAEKLPFDAKKIRAWAFCMTVLSAAWAQESGKITTLEKEVADAISKTKV